MKRIISIVLMVALLLSAVPAVYAATDDASGAASALYNLGLLKGTGTKKDGSPEFSISNTPTRNEAITMFVRLLGKESEAMAGKWTTPFKDVADWAKPYVGYAYANGLTNGTSATTFSGTNTISANEYLTFILRALGYSSDWDFSWDEANMFANQIELTNGEYDTKSKINRGDMILMSAKAVLTDTTSGNDLLTNLVQSGAVTASKAGTFRSVINNSIDFSYKGVRKNSTKTNDKKYTGTLASVIKAMQDAFPLLKQNFPHQEYTESVSNANGDVLYSTKFYWEVSGSGKNYNVVIACAGGTSVSAEFEADVVYENGKITQFIVNQDYNNYSAGNTVTQAQTNNEVNYSDTEYTGTKAKVIKAMQEEFPKLGSAFPHQSYRNSKVDSYGEEVSFTTYYWEVEGSDIDYTVYIVQGESGYGYGGGSVAYVFEAEVEYIDGRIIDAFVTTDEGNYSSERKAKQTHYEESYDDNEFTGTKAIVIKAMQEEFPKLGSAFPHQSYRYSKVDSYGDEVGFSLYYWEVEGSGSNYTVSIASGDSYGYGGSLAYAFQADVVYKNGVLTQCTIICDYDSYSSERNSSNGGTNNTNGNQNGTASVGLEIKNGVLYSLGTCTDQDIIIPDSVKKIDNRAFWSCTKIKSVVIPNSVTTIGGGAFWDCTSLISVVMTNSVSTNSVTTIGEYAFSGCTSLSSVEISNSVTSIGNHAFSDCINLSSVVIPNSVTTIGEFAFSKCAALSSVEISNSVATIRKSTFAHCHNLSSVTIPNSVKIIEEYAFCDCNNIGSVEMSNSVTRIGMYAFSHCTNLSSVEIPNSVMTIGKYAFHNCTNMSSVVIPKDLTEIEEYVFCGCANLSSVVIPKYVTKIGNSAFSGCTNLSSVEIPNSLTNIVYNAFPTWTTVIRY